MNFVFRVSKAKDHIMLIFYRFIIVICMYDMPNDVGYSRPLLLVLDRTIFED